jgi:riboflavin biosynthesis pyrimidine reductase
LEQLLPERRELAVDDAYGELALDRFAPPDRPYVIANMVASVDGRATLAGRSGGLGNEADKQIFLDLRTQADAVMAGTATIGIERYGPLLKSSERRAKRVSRGLDPVPLAVTATRTMELPVQAPLFADPESRIVVLTNSDREPPPCAARLEIERLKGDPLDLLASMERLRVRYGVRSLLLEGGPTLLGAMTAAGVVHELFLTRAAKLVGSGGEHTILEGTPPEEPIDVELVSLLCDGPYLFLRYRLGVMD